MNRRVLVLQIYAHGRPAEVAHKTDLIPFIAYLPSLHRRHEIAFNLVDAVLLLHHR